MKVLDVFIIIKELKSAPKSLAQKKNLINRIETIPMTMWVKST